MSLPAGIERQKGRRFVTQVATGDKLLLGRREGDSEGRQRDWALRPGLPHTKAAGRMHHVGRHLFAKGTANSVVEAGAAEIARAVLGKPITSVLTRMESFGHAVKLFVGAFDGRLVSVAVADETVSKVAKDSLVEMIYLAPK